MSESTNFDEWAVVELFGHQKIAGRVSEATIGGCSFLRVDVPETTEAPAFTKYYGNGAIYAMSPCTEDTARAAVNRLQAEPVERYFLRESQQPKLGFEDAVSVDFCTDCGEDINNCDCECIPI